MIAALTFAAAVSLVGAAPAMNLAGGDTPIVPITSTEVLSEIATSPDAAGICAAYPGLIAAVAGGVDDSDFAQALVDGWILDQYAAGLAPDHSMAFTAEGRATLLLWLHTCS
jgi:hypothetical protein